MIRAALIASALLLGGCGLFAASGPAVPAAEDTEDHRACRREAERSPAIRALLQQSAPGSETNQARIERERSSIFARAYRDCLRARGLGAPGGVEPQRPTR